MRNIFSHSKENGFQFGKKICTVAIALALVFPFARTATAAGVTSLSDTLTRLKASTAADHTIYFVTPTGLSAAQTITLTFSADFTGVSSIAHTDVDFATGSSATCTSATYTEQTLAASPSGATWGIGASGQVITITSGTGTVTANRCVRIKIGTNATTGSTGVNQITNGAADDDDTLTIGGTFGDSGTLAYDIITDDQVSITATVAPSITFTVDDNTVGFGTLSSTTGRWATGDTLGGNATAGNTPTAAHTLTIGTNASSGYSVTYNGATLTSSGNTITAASISSDSDGTTGSEQFALSVSASGDATIASGYARGTNSSWNFVPSTTTTIVSETVPTATETLSVSYLANISALTEAGSYSTTLTYIATGNF